MPGVTRKEREKAHRSEFLAVGDQVIFTITANPGGNAEKVLDLMVSSTFENARYKCAFRGWKHLAGEGRVACGTLVVSQAGGVFRTLSLVLRVGNYAGLGGGLHLKDEDAPRYRKTFSLKECAPNTIPIGTEIPNPDQRLRHIGRSIIPTWVIRGKEWIDAQRASTTVKKARWRTGRGAFVH